MPWTKDNNPEFLRLLKELNYSVKSRQGADEEIEGEGLREQMQKGLGIIEDVQNQQTNITDYYANYFATK